MGARPVHYPILTLLTNALVIVMVRKGWHLDKGLILIVAGVNTCYAGD